MARYTPDYAQIQSLIDGLEAGNEDALKEAQELSSRLAKRANSRLSALEKADLTSSRAYERAEYFLQEDQNRTRFSESKKLEGRMLADQLSDLHQFLNDNSSTISGEKQRRAGIESLIEEGKLSPDLTEAQKNRYASFMASDAWQEYKQRVGSPPDTVAKVEDAILSGATLKQFENLLQDYLERELTGELEPDEDIFTVWENWTGVDL